MKKLNYCGFGKRNWGLPFDYKITANCKIHDKMYKKGGSVSDRLKADVGFFWRNISDINKIESYNRKRLYIIIAIIYYMIVRLFGWLSFKYKCKK